MKKFDPVDIIIPTYDNLNQLTDCVYSMLLTSNLVPINIIVVNNGQVQVELNHKNIMVIKANENLGWTGGLKEGLKHSSSKYVMFANDDILIPRSSHQWLLNMLRDLMVYKFLGAVGPSSNVVMGKQNIWSLNNASLIPTSFLIGFCMLLNRDALDSAGGVHDMEYGGDDLDLSIRLRKSGFGLAIDNTVFIYHHGFQTGNKVFGDHTKENGWNSRNMIDNVNMELIRKHGFVEWRNTMLNKIPSDFDYSDNESMIVREFAGNSEKILELGCGGSKTIACAVGVDSVPNGEISPFIDQISVADVVADVEKELPFEDESFDCIIAKHILEHVVDPVKSLKLWNLKLKPGGILIISVPDETILDGIPLNPEHKHAYTPESLISLAKLCGFKGKHVADGYNNISFTISLEKI